MISVMVILTACGNGSEANPEKNGEGQNENQVTVFTTVYAWEEFAKLIGGEHVHVENVIPAGSDAHTFEPSARTMIDIAEGDIFLYNGSGMEGFADAVKDSLSDEDVKLVNVTEGMELTSLEAGHHEGHDHDSQGNESEHHHGDVDPHVWLDPLRAVTGAEKIKNALVDIRPEKEEIFEENFSELESRLQALHEQFEDIAASAKMNQFLVSHAGYGYWEQRYDLQQMSIAGVSTAVEPSQKELQALIKTAKERGMEHVLIEQNISSKSADVIIEELGAESLRLHNLESRTEEEVQAEEDYFSLMEQNLESLSIALKAK